MLIFFLLTGLSFKTESRIEFLTPGTGGTKVLGNIPEMKSTWSDEINLSLFLFGPRHEPELSHFSNQKKSSSPQRSQKLLP